MLSEYLNVVFTTFSRISIPVQMDSLPNLNGFFVIKIKFYHLCDAVPAGYVDQSTKAAIVNAAYFKVIVFWKTPPPPPQLRICSCGCWKRGEN
jgi:hypothetical protein